LNDNHRFSVFYNRRVDRPNEVDIRIFPKYDDAEIIKVGNPALRPQFTNSLELGYKTIWETGSWYSAIYHKFADGTTTRISSIVDDSNLIYAIFQNVNKSYNTGVEMVITQDFSPLYTLNFNLNAYRNQIDAFTVENLYPMPNSFSADQATIYSGNVKLNNNFHFPNALDLQVTLLYLAPDIIPQGEIQARFSMDIGLKKGIQNGQGELFFNASDLLSTLVIRRTIQGQGFSYTSDDYYETQVVRLGYSFKF
jgi:outer membrane receptor protein involved in Fe transport